MPLIIPIINQDVGQLWKKFNQKVEEPNYQRSVILVAVCIALLLDNMLYMVIVPIIPDFLRETGAWQTHKEGGRMDLIYDKHLNRSIPMRIGGRVVYEGEDAGVGFLFSIKALIQLLVNPFSGAIIDRIGYDIPMMIGLTIMFFSTSLFACGQSYGILFLARSLQGAGSAFADTGGLAMIADRFTEENERKKALGIALTFISFGCLFAPPFGGLLYEFFGKEVPFIILALVCLFDGFLVLIVMSTVKHQMKLAGISRPEGTPIYVLLQDKSIAVCGGALVMANVSLAFLEPTISIWMADTMQVEEWQIGMIWLPAFIPYAFGVYSTVYLGNRYPKYQWMLAAIGLALSGSSCLLIPFCSSFWELFLPISILCYGVAQVDTAVLPMLGYIVDTQYASVYGSIYAIADISYSIAYAFGPIIAGNIVQTFNFTVLNVIIAISNIAYCPVLVAIKHIHDYKPFENNNNNNNSDPGRDDDASKKTPSASTAIISNHKVIVKTINSNPANNNFTASYQTSNPLDVNPWDDECKVITNPFLSSSSSSSTTTTTTPATTSSAINSLEMSGYRTMYK